MAGKVKTKPKPKRKEIKRKDELFAALMELERRRELGEEVEITKSIQRIADEYEVTTSNTRSIYYNKVRNKYNEILSKEFEGSLKDTPTTEPDKKETVSQVNPKELEQEKEQEKEMDQETADLEHSLRTPELRPIKPPYKHGEIIECKVARILERVGAVCITMDGYEYQGLVHISRIVDNYVTDIHDYFREGEIIKAKFIKTNDRNELELSTVGLKKRLATYTEQSNEQSSDIDDKYKPIPNTSMAEKLLAVKEKLVTNDKPEHEVALRKISNEEEKIIKYLNGIVGSISPAAREELFDVIEEYGVFEWTLKMSDVAKDFHNDIGLLFVNMVREKIKEDGL